LSSGTETFALRGVDRGRGDVLVAPLAAAGQLDVQLVSDGLDPVDALGGVLGRPLLRVRRHVAGEGDDAALHRDADVRRVHARLPPQFPHDVLLEIAISHCADHMVDSFLSGQL
jgi:hypothetical protein